MADPGDLLEQVTDRRSFIAFVRALADEREQAQKLENANPVAHQVDGALGWKNADISSFLHAAVDCLIAQPIDDTDPAPDWKLLAEFLYFGKIYE